MTLTDMRVFHVTANTDTNECRGRTYTVGYFLHRNAATRAAHGRGTFGSDAPIEEKTMPVLTHDDGRQEVLVDRQPLQTLGGF